MVCDVQALSISAINRFDELSHACVLHACKARWKLENITYSKR